MRDFSATNQMSWGEIGAWLTPFPPRGHKAHLQEVGVSCRPPHSLPHSPFFFSTTYAGFPCAYITSACPVSAVHVQHASQVPGQQPTRAQHPSNPGAVEPTLDPAGLQRRRPPSHSSAQSVRAASFLHRTGLLTKDMTKKKPNVLFSLF